ncbi:MAG: sigma-54-dependent Fis family transcriptional regulator [Alphaproteobacteria bacterium]|nr:sigma-54-dependent Fis family transcriptional regulator [Alphaproteobacteria bacterium]
MPGPEPADGPPRVLVADDDRAVRYTLVETLRELEIEVVEAVDGRAALARLANERFDLVLTDLRMPGADGMAVLDAATALPEPPKVVLVTAHGSERTAVEAMKRGAWDYFRKPFDVDEVQAVVARALEGARLRGENRRLRDTLALSRKLLFRSASMERLAELVGRVAPRDVTVLITGESGTGKERVAEAIVAGSRRAGRPFVRFNCATLGKDLAAAELFGHTKGAFTGAVRDRPGLFGEADGGTLLLDEIAELDLDVQAQLLRVLQTGEVRRVGQEGVRKVDVRVLASTHRDLAERVAAGSFRDDLRWRLDVVRLHIPPLRERPEDIELLARHFLEQYASRFGVRTVPVPDELWARLRSWAWPGNVRELEHAMERLVALSPDGEWDLELLPGTEQPSSPVELDLKSRVEAYERGLIVAALRDTGGNRSEAARRLGIGRVTLYEKIEKYGL